MNRYGVLTILLIGVCLVMLATDVVARPSAYDVYGDGFYDETFPIARFSGPGWLQSLDPNSYFGGLHYTDTAGDTLEFSFWGEGFTLYGYMCNTTCATAVSLCIDDIPCTTFSTFFISGGGGVTGAYNMPQLEVTNLDIGRHDVTITSPGNGQRYHITAIHIHPVESVAPETTQEIIVNVTIPAPEITVEPFATPGWQVGDQVTDSDGIDQETVYEYKVTTGDQQITTWLIVMTLLLGALLVLMIWQGRSDG
jgi:hypothetical protein